LKKHKAIQNQQKLKFGEHYDNKDFVFTKEDRSVINPATFSKLFQNFMRDNSLSNIRLHDLRHTLATLLLEMEVNPKIVQEILGHTIISTTLTIYSHVSKKVKSDAIDKLSDILAK